MHAYDFDEEENESRRKTEPQPQPAQPDEDDDREVCPDCGGTNVDYINGTGGSCTSCFGGYLK